MKVKFYRCKHCGKIIFLIEDTKTPTICCGDEMTLLEPGTIDASTEKHVPCVEQDWNVVKVKIGKEPHPMSEDHHIQWICLVTNCGVHLKYLDVCKDASTNFVMEVNEKALEVYEYCNKHGLWVLKT